jgi:hypothetical protein
LGSWRDRQAFCHGVQGGLELSERFGSADGVVEGLRLRHLRQAPSDRDHAISDRRFFVVQFVGHRSPPSDSSSTSTANSMANRMTVRSGTPNAIALAFNFAWVSSVKIAFVVFCAIQSGSFFA